MSSNPIKKQHKSLPIATKIIAILFAFLVIVVIFYKIKPSDFLSKAVEMAIERRSPFYPHNSSEKMRRSGVEFVELAPEDEKTLHSMAENELRAEFEYIKTGNGQPLENLKEDFIYPEYFEKIKEIANYEKPEKYDWDRPCQTAREIRNIIFDKFVAYKEQEGRIGLFILITGDIPGLSNSDCRLHEVHLFAFKNVDKVWKIEAKTELLFYEESYNHINLLIEEYATQ